MALKLGITTNLVGYEWYCDYVGISVSPYFLETSTEAFREFLL